MKPALGARSKTRAKPGNQVPGEAEGRSEEAHGVHVEAATLPLDEQVSFWKPSMETRSKGDRRTPRPVFEICNEAEYPASEVEEGLSDGSPGPDKVKRAQLRSLPKASLLAHVFLAVVQVSTVSLYCYTLVPKSASASAPGEFRPITVATIISRLFHRLLAMRLECLIPLSLPQKAFRRGDGLADNVWLLIFGT